MVRRLALLVALLAMLTLAPDRASACHRERACYVPCTPCYVPACCTPCCPYPHHWTHCEGYWWNCCECRWVWVDVWCDCGPHNLPGWCYGYIWHHGWGSVYVYRCFYEEKEPGKPGAKPGKEEAAAPESATIVVSLPAEARLKVDGEATKSTSGTRVLSTPALDSDKEYSYTLTAEIVRDGEVVQAVSKKVSVRAGAESHVSFEMTTNVASK